MEIYAKEKPPTREIRLSQVEIFKALTEYARANGHPEAQAVRLVFNPEITYGVEKMRAVLEVPDNHG